MRPCWAQDEGRTRESLPRRAPQFQLLQFLLVDEARVEAVVKIVADIGDLVGEIDHLRLQRRLDETLTQPVRPDRACASLQ